MTKNGTSKIIFVNFSKIWGGGEAQYLALANEAKKQGQQVTIIAQTNSELNKRAKECNIMTKTIKINNKSFLNPIKLIHINSLLNQIKPDAIILNSSLELKLFTFATSNKHYRLIYRRGYYKTIKDKAINRFCIKRLSNIVAISEFTKNSSLKSIAPFALMPITIINNGIPTLKHTKLPDYKAKRIIAIGRLVKLKQFDLLIEAMPKILKSIPDASLWIIGEGKLKHSLTQLIKQLDLENHVILKGFSDNIPDLLSKCSLFVHPAREEAFGVVFLEAMRQHLACISFSGHAGNEIIEDEKTGFLVTEQRAEALSKNIASILNNKEILETMGNASYQRFMNHYTIHNSVKKYLNLINN